MARKVVILGSAESTRDLAPFDDPSWEIWGMAWRYKDHPRMDRCFEIHSEFYWPRYAGDLYAAWLKEPHTLDNERKPVDVYVRPDVAKKYKGCKPYPLDAAIKMMGGEYFTSSIGYMLAMALLEDVDEIALYGIDLSHDEEYAHQRPNAEYLLGMAHARGVKIHIPQQSALLKASWVYGKDAPPEEDPLIQWTKRKAKQAQDQIDDLKCRIFTMSGAKQVYEEVETAFKIRERGGLNNG